MTASTRSARGLVGLLLALTLGAAACTSTTADAGGEAAARSTDEASSPSAAPSPSPSPSPSPAPPIELPRGGRQIFPEHLVVMDYGSAQTEALGVLGEGTPTEAATILEKRAAPYGELSGRTVLPAFEFITTVAQDRAGPKGTFSYDQPDEQVQRYLDAARAAKMLMVLDFQPGREDFLTQVKRYEKFLLQPEVGVALDPEWVLEPGQRPKSQVGTTTAKPINDVSSYLANLTLKNKLPEKLFIVHQFQTRMIPDREQVVDRPGLATVLHVDGYGSQDLKLETYGILADTQGADRPGGQLHNGLKLFLDEDTNMFTPAEAMAITPRPELITYQ